MEKILPNVLVVCPHLGVPSEVWLLRQLIGFNKIRPIVLTWRCFDACNAQYGINVEIMNIDFNKDCNRLQSILNRLRGFKESNFNGPDINETNLIRRAIAKFNPDLILCHFGYTALRILPLAKSFNLPMIVHFHGRDLSVLSHNKWYYWSLKHNFKHFASIVVVGSHQRKLLIEKFKVPEEVINLIPCGVPTNEFIPKQDLLNRDSIRFISVSRLSEEKGFKYSLNAFNHFIRIFPNAHYIIIGDGPLRSDIEKIICKYGLGNKVTLKGLKSTKDVLKYLRSSDIFIQHSIESKNGGIEGFGVALAEAASVALPVIATTCGGISDQVIDGVTGYLVKPKDVDQMVNRMVILAQNYDLRLKMGLAGRARVVNNFDTKTQILKLEKVLLKHYI